MSERKRRVASRRGEHRLPIERRMHRAAAFELLSVNETAPTTDRQRRELPGNQSACLDRPRMVRCDRSEPSDRRRFPIRPPCIDGGGAVPKWSAHKPQRSATLNQGHHGGSSRTASAGAREVPTHRAPSALPASKGCSTKVLPSTVGVNPRSKTARPNSRVMKWGDSHPVPGTVDISDLVTLLFGRPTQATGQEVGKATHVATAGSAR
jgi:hypothetical protein